LAKQLRRAEKTQHDPDYRVVCATVCMRLRA
jgi:hypothetical protein